MFATSSEKRGYTNFEKIFQKSQNVLKVMLAIGILFSQIYSNFCDEKASNDLFANKV